MKKERISFLDGMRGLMALNVVICHFVVGYYPQMYYWEDTQKFGGFLSLFATTPLSVLVIGDVAVRYFFVLSSFLIASSVYKNVETKTKEIGSLVLKRYFRMVVMVGTTVLFTFLLKKNGLLYHFEIAERTLKPDFFNGQITVNPALRNLPFYMFIQPFFEKSELVGPFWTIHYELWGAIFSFIIASCLKGKNWKVRATVCLISGYAIIHFVDVNYFGFIAGILLADLIQNFKKYPVKRITKFLCWGIGLLCVTIPMDWSGIYDYLPGRGYFNTTVYRTLGITICMYCMFFGGSLRKILEGKVLQWMGKISFATYSVHFPIMLSLEAGLFGYLIKTHSYNFAAVLSFLITLPVIYIVSYAAWRFLDAPNYGKKVLQKLSETFSK